MQLSHSKLVTKNAHEKLNKQVVTIDFNESCNLHCLNCPRRYKIPDADNNNYWSFNDAKKFVDYIVKVLKPKRLDIGTLAEFTLYKYCDEILDYILNTYPELNVLITTNFHNVPKKLFDVIKKAPNGNLIINISLWSVDTDMYKRLQGGNINNVITNINTLLSLKSKANTMISTVDYSTKQIEEMQKFVKDLAITYDKEYIELLGTRSYVDDKLVLYRNVYMPDFENLPEDYEFYTPLEDIKNTSDNINYRKCEVISYNAFFTYNRCYPCTSTWEYFTFTLDNLDDLSYKLYKQISKANTLKACEGCSVGYTCLGKRI